MKRCLPMLLLALILTAALAVHCVPAATVYKLWICDGLTGGSATDLDAIHSGTSGVAADALAIVQNIGASGTSEVLFFYYSSGATDTENTATHPYTVVPDDLPANGVWKELSGVSAFGPQ